MKTPKDSELILIGLKDFKTKLNDKIKKDIEAFQAGRMSLDDLIKYLTTSNKELNKVISRINELDPPFSSDDIPF